MRTQHFPPLRSVGCDGGDADDQLTHEVIVLNGLRKCLKPSIPQGEDVWKRVIEKVSSRLATLSDSHSRSFLLVFLHLCLVCISGFILPRGL